MKKFKANGLDGVNALCGLKEGVPFRFYRFLGEHTQEDDLHYHPNGYEYYFVIKGKILIKINNKEIELDKNELLIVEPGEIHAVQDVLQTCDVIIIRNEFKEQDKVSIDNKKWKVNNPVDVK